MKKILGLTLLLLGISSLQQIQAKHDKPPKPVGAEKQESVAVAQAVPDSRRTIVLLATSLVALAAFRRRFAR